MSHSGENSEASMSDNESEITVELAGPSVSRRNLPLQRDIHLAAREQRQRAQMQFNPLRLANHGPGPRIIEVRRGTHDDEASSSHAAVPVARNPLGLQEASTSRAVQQRINFSQSERVIEVRRGTHDDEASSSHAAVPVARNPLGLQEASTSRPVQQRINFSQSEQMMIEAHLTNLRMSSMGRGVGGPIRNRDIRRGYAVSGSSSARPHDTAPNVHMHQAQMNHLRAHFLPSFGTSGSPYGCMLPDGTVHHGVRAAIARIASGSNQTEADPRMGMSQGMVPPNVVVSGTAGLQVPVTLRAARFPDIPEGMRTFVQYANERNPWLHYTERYYETIQESHRNYAAPRLRPQPYDLRRSFWAYNIINLAWTAESGVQHRNYGGNNEEAEVNSAAPGRRQANNLEPAHDGQSGPTTCLYCLRLVSERVLGCALHNAPRCGYCLRALSENVIGCPFHQPRMCRNCLRPLSERVIGCPFH